MIVAPEKILLIQFIQALKEKLPEWMKYYLSLDKLSFSSLLDEHALELMDILVTTCTCVADLKVIYKWADINVHFLTTPEFINYRSISDFWIKYEHNERHFNFLYKIIVDCKNLSTQKTPFIWESY